MKNAMRLNVLGAAILMAGHLPAGAQSGMGGLVKGGGGTVQGSCTNCVMNTTVPEITPPDPNQANGQVSYEAKWGYVGSSAGQPAGKAQPGRPAGQTAAATERWWCVNPKFKVLPRTPASSDPTAATARPRPPAGGLGAGSGTASTAWTLPFTLFLFDVGSGQRLGLAQVSSSQLPLPVGAEVPLLTQPTHCGRTLTGTLPTLALSTEWSGGTSPRATVLWAPNPSTDSPPPNPGSTGRPTGVGLPPTPASAATMR